MASIYLTSYGVCAVYSFTVIRSHCLIVLLADTLRYWYTLGIMCIHVNAYYLCCMQARPSAIYISIISSVMHIYVIKNFRTYLRRLFSTIKQTIFAEIALDLLKI